jgi:hypothetical protein
MAASDTARFAGGRGSVLDIQARPTTRAPEMPGSMSIIARYRGAVVVVDAARMKAMTATQRGIVMWKYRSPVRSACQAFR